MKRLLGIGFLALLALEACTARADESTPGTFALGAETTSTNYTNYRVAASVLQQSSPAASTVSEVPIAVSFSSSNLQ